MKEPSSRVDRWIQDRVPARLKEWASRCRKFTDKHLTRGTRAFKEPKWQRWALIVVTSFIAAFILAPKSFRAGSLTVGVPAKETIISPITFRVPDVEATNKIRDEVLKSIRPVYDFDDKMVDDVQSRIISAFGFMTTYLEEEEAYKANKVANPKPVSRDGQKKASKASHFRPLDETTLRTRFENALSVKISPSSFAVLKQARFNLRVQRDLRNLVVPVLRKGVVLSREHVMRDGKNGILLWSKSKERLEPLKDLSSIFDLKEAVHFINAEEKSSTRDSALSRAIRELAMELINFNITYDRERSATVKNEAEAQVKEVYFQVAKGEAIVKEGEPVNAGHIMKLDHLAKANPPYSRYMILVGFGLTLILVLRLSFYFSEKHLNPPHQGTEGLLLFCLLLIGTVVAVRFLHSLGPVTSLAAEGVRPRSIYFAAPVATGAMLMALMVDARRAFIFAALSALTASLAVEGDSYLFCFFFISGIVGLHGMSQVTDRTSILRAGLVVGLVNMLSVLAIKMALGELTGREELYEIGFGFVGGVLSGLLVLGLAPLLEPLGYITNVRLLEIANLNHPLLKLMAFQAPGTYHHSITVGNLAEAAAERIGANPILARVGGYYHDIGKVGKKTKPLYFIENQRKGLNPHDKLEPSMSALILVSHVKHGVEKARAYRLGQPIIDIIEQHHGTNLIRFFYNKACERGDKNHKTVDESKYRYPGPQPNSKEAALVMLADVVEAACRTLTEPTPSRIQKKVQSLIMGLFSEGQLDQSNLTLKDLHAITSSFVRALQGILHHRIDYPGEARTEEKANEDTHRKQAEKDRNRQERTDEEGAKTIKRLGL